MTAPARSREQRLVALRKANEIRVDRSRLKKDLAAGRLRIVDVLSAPPAYASGLKLREVLRALPQHGPWRVGRLLAQCRISESKTVGGLSDRQRAALIEHFRA
jgi:hypothetical protein